MLTLFVTLGGGNDRADEGAATCYRSSAAVKVAIGVALGLTAALMPSIVHASPGPPPPDYIMASVAHVVPTLTAATFDAYAAELAPDVAVTVNGETVARDKAAWVQAERHRLGKVDRRVLNYTPGWDSILVVDQYDDRSDVPPGVLADARPRTRAVRYAFGTDHLIHAIRIVETDGLMLRP